MDVRNSRLAWLFASLLATACKSSDATQLTTADTTAGGGGTPMMGSAGMSGAGMSVAGGPAANGGNAAPSSVMCGSSKCTAPMAITALSSVTPTACCLDAATNACGFVVSGTCTAPAPDAPKCPGSAVSLGKPCCISASNLCGIDGTAFGMGCMDILPGAKTMCDGTRVAPAGATAGSSAAGGGSAGAGGQMGAAQAGTAALDTGEPKWNDPGSMPWAAVPDERVAEECKLDKAMLTANDSKFPSGWAVVRYGKLCHDRSSGDRPTEAYSATKTLGGVVTGIASYETRMFAKSGPRTGQLLDTDLASHWLMSQSYNSEALVAHVLGMEAHNTDLSLGKKTFTYDAAGSVQINTLGTMVETAIAQDATRLGTGIHDFARKFLFEVIGMTDSTWSGTTYATSWSTTLHDMARLGLLMVHRGMWSGKRVLDESWIYKMTHPSFEDANTAYGYLTWLNARAGRTDINAEIAADDCAPAALWPKYPHKVSGSPDCNYGTMSCAQKFDVGAWSAQGAGGQVILGHPALDLVIVAKDVQQVDCGPSCMWSAVRGALVAHDPMFKGDADAFCKAYANGDYAPDIQVPFMAPADTTL